MPMKRTSSSLESAMPSSSLSMQPPKKRSKTMKNPCTSQAAVTQTQCKSKPATPRQKPGSARASKNSASASTSSRRKKSSASARAKGKASKTVQRRCPSLLKRLIGMKDPAEVCQEYILQTESRKLLVYDIYKCFLRDFPQLRNVSPEDTVKWQNRIRWFLSFQNRFVMVDQDTERKGSPYYYTVLPDVKGNRPRKTNRKTLESAKAAVDSVPGADASTAACASPSDCGDPTASQDDPVAVISAISPKMEKSEGAAVPIAPLFPSPRGMLCGVPAPCLPVDLPSRFGHSRTPLPGVLELFLDPIEDPTLNFVRGGFHPGPPQQTPNGYDPLHSTKASNAASGSYSTFVTADVKRKGEERMMSEDHE